MPSIVDQMRDEEARDELQAWEATWRPLLDGPPSTACACRLVYVADNGRAMPQVDASACPAHAA